MFHTLGATILKARPPNLSLDRGKNKSKFDADLRTLGRVESVKTGCIKLEMYDRALLQVFVCRLCVTVCTECIVAKWCALPGAKVTIDSLYEVVYEKLIGTKMNDLDLCLEVVSWSCQPLGYI